LIPVQPGRGFEIWQRTRDDADINTEEQPAKTRDEQEKPVVTSLGSSARWFTHTPDVLFTVGVCNVCCPQFFLKAQ
jgi:hypothetical protein